MKEVKQKRVSKVEQLRQRNATAMPDVKEIVKKHGLTAVQSCLSKLREYEKKARHAAKLREEADALERELDGAPRIRAAG